MKMYFMAKINEIQQRKVKNRAKIIMKFMTSACHDTWKTPKKIIYFILLTLMKSCKRAEVYVRAFVYQK